MVDSKSSPRTNQSGFGFYSSIFFLFLFNLLYYFWPVCNELVQHIAHDQIDEVYGMIVADGSLCVDHCCAHGLFNINPKQRKSIENCTHVSFSFGNN